MAGADAEVARKRKAHTKSRMGCGNCKLRRVKVRNTIQFAEILLLVSICLITCHHMLPRRCTPCFS
jgi:hypothetical protein